MTNIQKIGLFLLRIGLGWYFFYAGITKVLDPKWTAAGYLKNAKSLDGLYEWFASSSNIGWVNFLNEWGLTLLGIALIVGAFVKWASIAASAMMVLYYFPILAFPKVGERAFLVDDHIIFIFAYIVLYAFNAGMFWGVDGKMKNPVRVIN